MVSSELPEVLGVADRIVVMKEGRTAGELARGASETDVLALAVGQSQRLPAAAEIPIHIGIDAAS